VGGQGAGGRQADAAQLPACPTCCVISTQSVCQPPTAEACQAQLVLPDACGLACNSCMAAGCSRWRAAVASGQSSALQVELTPVWQSYCPHMPALCSRQAAVKLQEVMGVSDAELHDADWIKRRQVRGAAG
jgi:hypothetical protein